MTIAVLTPDQQVFAGEIKSVKVPGTSGQFQVLNNHAPIVSSLENGKVEIVTTIGEKLVYEVEGGFIEVLNNEVSLLVQGLSQNED